MKTKLEICCGTACYLLGAGKLMTLEQNLPPTWSDKVDIQFKPCLDKCTSEHLEGAPFVRLDDEIITRATPEKIMDRLREKLEGIKND